MYVYKYILFLVALASINNSKVLKSKKQQQQQRSRSYDDGAVKWENNNRTHIWRWLWLWLWMIACLRMKISVADNWIKLQWNRPGIVGIDGTFYYQDSSCILHRVSDEHHQNQLDFCPLFWSVSKLLLQSPAPPHGVQVQKWFFWTFFDSKPFSWYHPTCWVIQFGLMVEKMIFFRPSHFGQKKRPLN